MGNKIALNKPVIYLDDKNLPTRIPIVDAFTNSIEELFYIRNPKYKKGLTDNSILREEFIKKNRVKPVWIYYPWENKIICIPEEKIYLELRTARNKNLIPLSTQKEYRQMVVGVIGLSVGSSVVHYLSYTGGPKRMKLADFDTIEITNLNRIHANLLDYGKNKTMVAAQQVWSIDPFAELFLYPEGISNTTLESFIINKPTITVLVDAMDSLPLKVKARQICRGKKIPVIMATSNGDCIIIDIERFDLEPNRPLFHNRLGEIKEEDFEYMNYQQWLKLATEIVGFDTLTDGMKESLKEIGKTLSSVPQLASTVDLGGLTISFILRQIASDKSSIKSGRYLININKYLL